jgi:hypothetical protein
MIASWCYHYYANTIIQAHPLLYPVNTHKNLFLNVDAYYHAEIEISTCNYYSQLEASLLLTVNLSLTSVFSFGDLGTSFECENSNFEPKNCLLESPVCIQPRENKSIYTMKLNKMIND